MILFFALHQLATASIPPEIENEQTQGVNKLPYHSTLVPYGDLKQALRTDRAASTYSHSLNGAWKFHWVKRPEERPVDFYKQSFDVSGWKTIPVPSNWQVLGYGTPYYSNSTYTFQKNWPKVMSEPPKDWTAYEERNPVGSYRRSFSVPAGWEGREVFLKFDGVDAGFFLWINGEKVGYSQNSRNAAEFDITPFLRKGKNDVAVEVYRYTSGSYFEDQDMWRLSGIFRNVTLWSAPKLHIQDTFITTEFDSKYHDASLKIVNKIHNYGRESSPSKPIAAVLYGPDGKPVPGVTLKGQTPVLKPGDEASVTLEGQVTHPKKWSAEDPNLYTVVLTLDDETEIIAHKIGFRKIEIVNRVFMINGKPVKLKGANRHEMSPETGHYVTEADMIRDLTMLKRANCNHVRTCHYSDDPRWYELCDEWGIYLVAEANAESHGYMGVLDNEPRFEKMVVDRNVANVENFKNHASVVIWSMGNECGGGTNFHSAQRVVKALDPSRPTHYEPFGDEFQGNPASIESHMYTDPASLESIANDPRRTLPMYLCEYAHAMNNSMGSVGEYNDLIDKYPALMGGAIWEWEDQGLWNRRNPKHPILAYGGGFGEVPNDQYFIHKGVVFSDRSPKPHFPELKRAYQWVGFKDLGNGRILVKNRFSFTDLSKFDFKWTLVSDSGTVVSGQIPSISLLPGAEKELSLNLPKFKLSADSSLYLNLAACLKTDERWASHGYEVANAQFAIHTPTNVGTPDLSGSLEVTKSRTGDIQIKGAGFSVEFSHSTGTLSELTRDGRNVLLPGGGPKLHLWRAQHRNDDGWAAHGWATAGLAKLVPEVLGLTTQKKATGEVIVSSSVRYQGTNGFSAHHFAAFTVYPNGTIAVDNGVSPSGQNISLARLGVRLLLNPNLKELKYFARGPMENYSDRKRGSDIGLYTSSVTEQMTPYEKPQECGNHEDLKWLTLSGNGIPTLAAMSADEPLQFSALPYRDEQMEDVAYRIDLPKSDATVLILSGKTLGVGSSSCGPRPLPEYRLDCTPRRFSYVLHIGTSSLPMQVPKRSAMPILVSQSGDGKTSLMSDGPIEISNDGKVWTTYTAPIEVDRPTRMGVRTPSFEGIIAVKPLPAKLRWKTTASSFENGEGNASHATDNDPSTFWHTRYTPTVDPSPHSLVVDFVSPTLVSSVLLTPRQDMSNGRIRGYEIYLSDDGMTWGKSAAQGDLPNSDAVQTIRLAHPTKARFLRLVAVSEWSNGGFASLAELDIR